MKKGPFLTTLIVAAAALAVWGCGKRNRPPGPPIVQIHFAGAQAISRDTNSAAFNLEFCSPEARALESQTLDKLSRAPGVWFKDKLPAGVSHGSAQLRPLLDDFLKSEWTFEMREAPDSPEYTLAIRLDAARAQLWQTNLRSLLESWTKISANDISNGWELKKDLPPNLFRFVRAGDWIVIGCGQDDLPLSDEWVQGNFPVIPPGWVSANLDWPRLARIFPELAKLPLPSVKMQVSGSNSNLVMTGKMELSQPLPVLEKWQVPSPIIYEPLTSFTAARGFGPWLQNQAWAKPLDFSPEPDQLFVWSLGSMPMQTFIAVPTPNATNALMQLGQNLSTDTQWQDHLMSPFKFEKTADRISLAHVPFAAPEVRALHEPTGDLLFADVFPNPPRGKFPPPALYQQLAPPNLVYYHWEVTSVRLKVLPQITQLALLLTRHQQLDAQSAAGQWLKRIGPTLGASVTEVAQTGPSELSFVRQAPGGLTAFELIVLANWLQAPNFPGCDLSLPPERIPPASPPVSPPIARPMKTLTGAPAAPAH